LAILVQVTFSTVAYTLAGFQTTAMSAKIKIQSSIKFWEYLFLIVVHYYTAKNGCLLAVIPINNRQR
jgi:hypothetical protein